jgi:hypothetical protein
MVDKDEEEEDAQDTVARIKDEAQQALYGASSAIEEAMREVQILIDDHDCEEAEAICDAVEELSFAIYDLEAAEDALQRADGAVQRIGLVVKENEGEDEGGEENDEEGDEAETA